MFSRPSIAIDIGRQRLRALLAQRDGTMLRVRKTLIEDLPSDLDVDDAAALGQWVRESLKNAGFPRGNVSLALAREHVGLKRLHLPTRDEHELPEMTRLSMQQEMPFDAEGAVIDFFPVSESERGTTVVAVAVPRSRLEQAVNTARAAKLGLQRISLRSMGSALLLKNLGERTAGSVLAIDITGESLEFCVIDDGAVRFSRAAEFSPDYSREAKIDAVITETRRTWMSYRMSEDAAEITRVILLGDKEICSDLRGRLGEMLRVDAERLESHPLVDPNGHDIGRLWPLAGMLLEPDEQKTTIDFAHPTRAPDRAAARRKKLLYAAGLGMLLVLGAWTFASRDLARLEAESARLLETQQEMLPRYVRYHREEYRLEHIDRWKAVRVDWLEHLQYLASLAPEPAELVLGSWIGNIQFRQVQYDARRDEWSAPRQITINASGEARNRQTADRFREALVRGSVYDTSSTGPDAPSGRRLPFGFSYRLQTEVDMPHDEEPDEPDAEQADSDEAVAQRPSPGSPERASRKSESRDSKSGESEEAS